MKQKRNGKQKLFGRVFAMLMSMVLLFSGLSGNLLTAYADELDDTTETTEIRNDELEYQTIRALPGEDEAESVTLDGLMPVNAEVNVQNSAEYTGENLFAYDISITDQVGGNFQPESSAPIKVEITNAAIGNAFAAEQKPRLWHIDDSGIREEIKNFKIKDDTITFEAAGFSVYELDDGTNPLRTYEFLMPDDPANNTNYHEYYFPTSSKNSDGTFKEIWKQTIKGSEKPVFPQLPADLNSQYTFVGWFIDSPNGTMFDFENVPAVTENETVQLYAVFKSCVYAIFHDQYNGRTDSFPVFATRRGDMVNGTASVEYQDLIVTYDDSDDNHEEGQPPQMAFKGWTTEEIKDYTSGGSKAVITTPTLELTATTDYYPVFEPIRWLEFVSGESGSGATYIPPKFFPSESGYSFSDPGASSAPVRAGYAFDGWFTEDGARVTDNNQNLVANLNTSELRVRNGRLYFKDTDAEGQKVVQVTLKARWTPANAKYTVIIWRQKVTDEPNAAVADRHYDFAESFTIDATTEQIVSVANNYKNLAGSGDYVGFHYGRCDAQKEVAGDNSTILNVYYDRNVHTFKFRVKSNGWGNNYTQIYEFTALYGAYIKDHFPIPGYTNYIWEDNSNPKVYSYTLATVETMPNSDVTFTGESRDAVRKIYYYVEIDSDDTEGFTTMREFNGKLYGLYKTVNHGFNYLTYDEEYHPIEGYIRDRQWAIPYFGEYGMYARSDSTFQDISMAPIGGRTKNRTTESNINNLFYDRDDFKIEFIDSADNERIDLIDVKYRRKLDAIAPQPPAAPVGKHFTGWYIDKGCTTRLFFQEPTQEEIDSTKDKDGVPHYQVYDRMPAFNLLAYAGWAEDYFRIEVDPNGGELASGQSTFFWKKYGGDPIEEYKTASRNYEEDVNGTFYYYLHDRKYWGLGDEWETREDDIDKRGAGYTTDIFQATSATRYREAPGVYRYLGWYEVDPVTGAETPYNFGTYVTKDTYLRLHWKQLGTYNIKYDAGSGTIDQGDQNEATFVILDADDYSDHADVVVTRVAKAWEGLNFVGWRIKNDPSGRVYYPGQSFQFSSAFAQAVSQVNPETGEVETKRVITLNAVYEEIKNTKIIYDANGGEINESAAILPENAGGNVLNGVLTNPFKPGNEGNQYAVDGTQLTVSDLVNNSAVKLSNGKGFSNHGYKFLGWSTKPDGTGTCYDPDSIKNYAADTDEPLVLYAQWEVRVYFDKNNDNAPNTNDGWGGDWTKSEDPVYTWDETAQMYYTTINLNATVARPAYTPVSDNPEEMFRYWSAEKQTTVGVMQPDFDFSTPVTQEIIGENDRLILYGCWSAPIKIPVYYVNTTDPDWVREDAWLADGLDTRIVLHDSNEVPFTDISHADAYAATGATADYDWAFACTQKNGDNDYQNISEDTIIKAIWYDADAMKVMVRYSDDSEHVFDPAQEAVYLVYYKSPETIPVKYDRMSIEGGLTPVTVMNAATVEAHVTAEPYVMGDAGHIGRPLYWANINNADYKFYSFAVGAPDAEDASGLKVISDYKTTDTERPALQVKNTWKGFQYSLDGETWHDCGYDIALYAIYYEQRPTIVTLTEKTIGLPEDMSEEFEYTVQTKTNTKTTKVTRYYTRKGNYGNYTYTLVEEQAGASTTASSPVGTVKTYNLSDQEMQSFVLLYSKISTADGNSTYNYYAYQNGNYIYSRKEIDTEITQTITIVQTLKDDYKTTNNAKTGDDEYNSSYTSSADDDTVTITYTNTHELKLMLHTAIQTENGILAQDSLRVDDTALYEHEFTGSGTWNFAEDVSPENLIREPDEYVFLGTAVGSKDAENLIDVGMQGVTKVSFGKISENRYGYYLNDDTAKLLGEQDIWYVYCQKPRIRYQFEKPDGTLIDIDPLKRNSTVFNGNGYEIAQNEILPVTTENGLLLSQISTPGTPAFLIPSDFDFNGDPLRLDLNRLAVGDASGVQVSSDSKEMAISIENGNLCYRFSSGDAPQIMPASPVVYAIYRVKGYELTLTKTVRGDSGGVNDFTFTISSDQITNGRYYISGYSGGETITPENGKLTLTLHAGESVTLYGLLSGNYTISEEASGSYEMTAAINGVDAVVSNNQVAANIRDNTRVDVVNTYPVPVTGAGEHAEPYLVILLIMTTAALLFVCRRKEEKAYECSSL